MTLLISRTEESAKSVSQKYRRQRFESPKIIFSPLREHSEIHTQKYKRKLTVTLAYFSPIHPSSIKYREKQVWFDLIDPKKVVGSRSEYDYHAVQRGTLQHEIFESESIAVWDENDSIVIKVSCRGDASESNPDIQIPYALFATFVGKTYQQSTFGIYLIYWISWTLQKEARFGSQL